MNFFRSIAEVNICPSCKTENLEHLDAIPSKRCANERIELVSGCRHCGLVFVNPGPSEREQQKLYSEGGDWNERKNSLLVGATPRTKKYADESLRTPPREGRRIFDQFVDLAKDRSAAPVLLDFGCGMGRHLDSFKRKGFKTFGIDPATHSFVKDHEMLTDIPEEPIFDIIYCNHVLEHLVDPLGTLRSLRKAVRLGGAILIGTPTLDGLEFHGKKRYCINWSDHISAFTQMSMTSLLSLAGFNAQEFEPGDLIYRMRCVATPGDVKLANDPLRDARKAFRAYERREGLRGYLTSLLPIRLKASMRAYSQARI